jgi:hypothetical protein
MMGTINCIYETPCHWCSKWDKVCDKTNPTMHTPKKSTVCNHDYVKRWVAGELEYICSKCGKIG